jgi:hypothetical protein
MFARLHSLQFSLVSLVAAVAFASLTISTAASVIPAA